MSAPSLESLIAQHLPLHGEYRAGNVGCTCGWEAFVKVDPIADDLDEFKTETFAKHVAEVIRQHGLDRTSGLNAAADVVHSEARYQWEMDARRAVCAQVVAQRMSVVERTIRSFADGAEDHQ